MAPQGRTSLLPPRDRPRRGREVILIGLLLIIIIIVMHRGRRKAVRATTGARRAETDVAGEVDAAAAFPAEDRA